jgi:hypothetical protein
MTSEEPPDRAKVIRALYTLGYTEDELPASPDDLKERLKTVRRHVYPRAQGEDHKWAQRVNVASELLLENFSQLRNLVQPETTPTDDSSMSREPTYRRTEGGNKQEQASQTGRRSSSTWRGAEDLGDNAPPTLRPSVVDFGEILPGPPLPPPLIVRIRGHVTPRPRVRAQPNFGRWWSVTVRTDQPDIGDLGLLTLTITDPTPFGPGLHTDTTTIWVGDVSLLLTIRCKVALCQPDVQSHANDIPSSSLTSRDDRRAQIEAERAALAQRKRYLPDRNFTVGGFILGLLALFLVSFLGLLEILYAVDIYRPANNDYGQSVVPVLVGSLALMSVIALVRGVAVERRRSLEREIYVLGEELKELE